MPTIRRGWLSVIPRMMQPPPSFAKAQRSSARRRTGKLFRLLELDMLAFAVEERGLPEVFFRTNDHDGASAVRNSSASW